MKHLTADEIAGCLRSYRYRFSSERDLNLGVVTALCLAKVPYFSEYSLGAAGRVDFYVPRLRLGVELKTKGTWAALLRQLQRYAERPEIDRLFVLTNRVRLSLLPLRLAGKPVRVIFLRPNL